MVECWNKVVKSRQFSRDLCPSTNDCSPPSSHSLTACQVLQSTFTGINFNFMGRQLSISMPLKRSLQLKKDCNFFEFNKVELRE